jgi:hypothetical protein
MNTVNDSLRWIGTVTILLGAVLTSLNLYPYNVYAFNLGSLLWCTYAFRVKDKALFTVNSGMIVIYLFGTISSL